MIKVDNTENTLYFKRLYTESGCVSLREFARDCGLTTNNVYRSYNGEGGFSRATMKTLGEYETKLSNRKEFYKKALVASTVANLAPDWLYIALSHITQSGFMDSPQIHRLENFENAQFIKADQRRALNIKSNWSSIVTTILIRMTRLVRGFHIVDMTDSREREDELYALEGGRIELSEAGLLPILQKLSITQETQAKAIAIISKICEKLKIDRMTNLGRYNVSTIYSRREEVRLELFKLFALLDVI